MLTTYDCGQPLSRIFREARRDGERTSITLACALTTLAVAAPEAAADASATKAATQCPPTFRVQHNDRIGPAVLPQGALPKNWRLKPTIALFFKPGNSKRKRFRVDPAT